METSRSSSADDGGRVVPDVYVDALFSSPGGFCPPTHLSYLKAYLDSLPPLTRRERFRSWRRSLVVDVREWVALRIAPWLERDPYD